MGAGVWKEARKGFLGGAKHCGRGKEAIGNSEEEETLCKAKFVHIHRTSGNRKNKYPKLLSAEHNRTL